MKCPNCGNTITCGCQKRKASNGVEVCSSCVLKYENQLASIPKPLVNNQFNK